MKTLTHYEKIWIGGVIVLICVLGFYLGKAVYGWSVKEPPQIGSSVQAYPAKVVTEWEKQVEPIGKKQAGYLGVGERIVPPDTKKESPEDYIGALLEKYPPPPIKIYTEYSKSVIRHGSLKILVGAFPHQYIQIWIVNKYGEEQVYSKYSDGFTSTREWVFEGKWQDDFYSFARKVKKEVDDKYAKREEEARQKTKKVLEAYK